MALFSFCRKMIFSRPLNIIYSEFHTLRKFENSSFTKRNLTPYYVTPKRNFFWIFKKRSKREIRAKDQPPDSYELIYRMAIDHYFLVGQYGLFFLSVTVAFTALYASNKWGDTTTLSLEPGRPRPQPVNDSMLGLFSAFIFIVCLYYFYMARMPMRIYYCPEKQKYLMYFYGPVPDQIKKQTVQIGDIQPLPDKGIMPWSDLVYQHKRGQKVMLFENYFRNPADLFILLGWQKDPKAEGSEREEDKK